MLSYRHSFHAGNFADIIKHIVLVEILEHLTQKEAPFEYIDTHSGAGLYNLKSNDAQKLQEHANGIAKIESKDFPELARYFEVINTFNKSGDLNIYPGSPSIAQYFLRKQDRAWLFELHPQDYESLSRNIRSNKKIRGACQDGLTGMTTLLPPTSRRGLILIDPSYEIKSEYDHVIDAVIQAYKKFSTGIYAIWYPVVDRQKIDHMEKKLIRSGIKNIQRFELGLSADSEERGMSASGLFVINPPWKLLEKMDILLPRLAQKLGKEDEHFYKCDIISGE
ncbi:MAG: 23S rRNA (adenine(2030)-N(6))-methyltransferase RlmJ [Porticoccus sp.]|nr:23S rRNA (adenine(2030)-N(6))-methyltransferase RlmJ [Porticoccus sp.]